jgi:hypothetical protein
MNTLLDQVRRWLGEGSAGSPLQQANWDTPVPTRPSHRQAETLGNGTRRFLRTATTLAGIVTVIHRPLADALADAHGTGPLQDAHAILTWPLPLTQPVLAGVAFFVLGVIGVRTHGWRQVTSRQGRYLFSCSVAAVLGAGPTVLLFAVLFAAVTLAIAIAAVLFITLVVLLIAAR